MNLPDVIKLLRKLKAYKPQQELDELTAEAWLESLGEYAYADADRALVELVGVTEWVDIDDIKKRVKHYRAERIDRGFGSLLVPSGLSPTEFTDWSRQVRKLLAAGQTALQINEGRTFEQLPEHNILQLLGNPR